MDACVPGLPFKSYWDTIYIVEGGMNFMNKSHTGGRRWIGRSAYKT